MRVFKYKATPKVKRPMPLHAGGANTVVVKPDDEFETEFDLTSWVEDGFLTLEGVEGEPDEPDEITAKVGAMEATVEAGPDGKLGTDDDTTTIKPVAKAPVKKAAKKPAKKAAKATDKKPPVKRRRRRKTAKKPS